MKIVKKTVFLITLSMLACVATFYGMEQPAEKRYNFPDYFLKMPSAGMTQDYATSLAFNAAVAYARQHLMNKPIAALDEETFLHEMKELHKRCCPREDEKPGYIRTNEMSIVLDPGIGNFEKAIQFLESPLNGQKKALLLQKACTKGQRYGSMENAWSHLSKKEKEVYSEIGTVAAMPEDVLDLLKAMVNKLNELQKENADPVEIAAFVHMELTRIHPFKDGNGRIARLLMNLILIQNNCVPVVFFDDAEYTQHVKAAHKDWTVFAGYLRQRIEELKTVQLNFRGPSQEEIDTYNKKQEAKNLCNKCGKEAPQLCGRCKSIKYCSVECQRVDWPTHKKTCTKK